jgi:hypothetical protein
MSDSQMANDFVQLGRTFHELAKHARESDSFDLNQAFVTGPRLSWSFSTRRRSELDMFDSSLI